MKSLQDKIAKWIMSHCKRCHYEVEEQTALMEANSILSLPVGLEVVQCVCKPDTIVCPYCDGTLLKFRDLTIQDLIDDAIETARSKEVYRKGLYVRVKEGL